MKKTFLRVHTDALGTLDFTDSGVYSYASTTFGALIAVKSKEFDSGKTTVKASVLSGGFVLNTFALTLTKCESVTLAYKRTALEVPPEYGGFTFGKKCFRTISTPINHEPIIEVPFEVPFEASDEVSFEASDEVQLDEALIGLA